MRVIGTLLGSALALIAYLLWPTWEGRRANLALAKLIDSYRAHINAVLGERHRRAARNPHRRPRRPHQRAGLARTPARRAQARAGKSGAGADGILPRQRPSPDPHLAVAGSGAARRRRAAADAGTRGVRRARSIAPWPPSPTHCAKAKPPQLLSPRAAERRLAEALAQDATLASTPAGMALADTCDRIADSVDTLAHLLRSAQARDVANGGVAAAG